MPATGSASSTSGSAVSWLDRVDSEGYDEPQALFETQELAEVVPVLARAFSAAGAGDDVLLLSTSRRDRGLLSLPLSATARMFVQDNAD